MVTAKRTGKTVAAKIPRPARQKLSQAAQPRALLKLSPAEIGSGAFHGDVSDIIDAMRNGGVRGQAIPNLAKRVGMSQRDLLKQLRLPVEKIDLSAPLSGPQQDRVYRAEKVLARAQQVLEDAAAAKGWIARPNLVLGSVSPLSLLDTEAGYELVLDTLSRIEFGVFS